MTITRSENGHVTVENAGVGDALRYRMDLFKGTAEYYDRFRRPYPPALLDDLRARVPLGPRSRVLDLACGTGQIAFALASGVADVLAVDQEPELVAFGARKARALGVANVTWLAAAAEDVALEGVFDLVGIGNAFHRLKRDVVTKRLVAHLAPRGCVALLWSGTPWGGDKPWHRALARVLERWQTALGANDRVPAGWEEAIERDPHEAVLRRAGLAYEGELRFSAVEQWTVDTIAGFMYSTSFLNRMVLGDHVDEFEADLRAELLACEPTGAFEQEVSYAYKLARRVEA